MVMMLVMVVLLVMVADRVGPESTGSEFWTVRSACAEVPGIAVEERLKACAEDVLVSP